MRMADGEKDEGEKERRREGWRPVKGMFLSMLQP